MSKARTLANLISDNAELADGQISVAEVVGAAPTASPTFTGNIGAAGNITNASGNLTLDVAGDIILNADGGDIKFQDGGSNVGSLINSSGFVIKSDVSDADIKFQGVDNVSTITALTLDMSAAGAATFSSSVTANPIYANSDGEGSVYAGILQLRSSNTASGHFFRWDVEGTQAANKLVGYWNDGAYRDRFSIAGNTGETVVNDSGQDVDFRVESDNNSHMLFVDGGTNGVGINGTPYINFAASSFGHLVFGNSYSTDGGGDVKNSGISWPSAANGNQVISSLINASQDGNYGAIIQFHTRGSGGGSLVERMRIDESQVTINEDSRDQDFRVESNNNANMLFVNGGNDRIGVGTAGPEAIMHVYGDLKATYHRPLNSTNQTSSANGNFWKLGRIYLPGPYAGEIVLDGTKPTYSSNQPSIARTTILLRGGTNADTLEALFFAEGDTSSVPVESARYVPVGNYSFDIYVKLGNYSSLSHTVTTGGSWTAALTNTGSTSNPANSVGIPTERSFWLGDREVLRQTQTETVINETSNDHDFRVESDSHANALFVDASTGGTELSTTQSNVGLFIHNTTHDSIVQIQSSGTNKNSTIRFADGDDADVGKIDYDHANDSLKIFNNADANGLELSGTKGKHHWTLHENWGSSNYNMGLSSGTVFQRKGSIADDVKIRVFQGTYNYHGGSIEYVIRKDSGNQTIVGSGVIYFNAREGDSGHTIVGSNVSSQIVVNGDTSSGTNADGKFTFNIRGTNGDSHISINNRLGSTVNMTLKFNILYSG